MTSQLRRFFRVEWQRLKVMWAWYQVPPKMRKLAQEASPQMRREIIAILDARRDPHARRTRTLP